MFNFFEEEVAGKLGVKLVVGFADKLADYIQDIKQNGKNKLNDEGGYGARIGSSGHYAQIGSSGDDAQIGSSGYGARIGSSGYYAQIGSNGYCAQIGSSGNYAQIGSSGNYAQIGSSGNRAQIDIFGKNSVGFACGYKTIIKAKKGTWISLCEWKREEANYIPAYAKSAQVGNKEYTDYAGKILNEDTYYVLWKREFYPVEEFDGITTLILSKKKRDNINIIKAIDLDYIYVEENPKEIYIATEGELSAHGYTVREAIEDLTYKKLDNVNVDEIVAKIKQTGKVTRSQYRAITGACSFGTNKFCVDHNIQDLEEIEIDELRKILVNDYGAEKFWRLIDGQER